MRVGMPPEKPAEERLGQDLFSAQKFLIAGSDLFCRGAELDGTGHCGTPAFRKKTGKDFL